jgi:hypothetical protein
LLDVHAPERRRVVHLHRRANVRPASAKATNVPVVFRRGDQATATLRLSAAIAGPLTGQPSIVQCRHRRRHRPRVAGGATRRVLTSVAERLRYEGSGRRW